MKKGFTLIELLVSLVLVAVVLTSMSAALVKLRSTYDKANDVTDIDLVTSSITRIISKDILSLKELVDAKLINEKTIELLFSDGKKRTIIIENIDGFETKEVSMDIINSKSKECVGYTIFRNAMLEQRIKLLKLYELIKEITNLEKNETTGKIDHPRQTIKVLEDGTKVKSVRKGYL